jgi:hypothetical protein
MPNLGSIAGAHDCCFASSPALGQRAAAVASKEKSRPTFVILRLPAAAIQANPPGPRRLVQSVGMPARQLTPRVDV